jgi:hypothetical protein
LVVNENSVPFKVNFPADILEDLALTYKIEKEKEDKSLGKRKRD